MKKHNILKVVLISVLVLFLCTWLFPSYTLSSTELTEGARTQMGIFDLFAYPTLTLTYFGYIFVYVLLVGAFYGVANKIPAYRKLLDKIVKGYSNKAWLFLAISTVLIAVITSVTGMSFGIVFLFPLIISIVLLMGYNKLVAATVTVGASAVGMIGTTIGEQAVASINNALSSTVTITTTTEMITKIALLVISLIILVFNLLRYAKKTKGKMDNEDSEFVPEKVKATEVKSSSFVPFIVIFDLVVLIMIMSLIPWESVFKLDIFSTALKSIQDFNISDFTIFSKILGTVNAFGSWSMSGEVLTLLAVFTIVLGLFYKVKINDFIDNALAGMKKALFPAAMMVLVYTCLIIVTFHPFQLLFSKLLLGLTDGLNVVTMTAVAFISSIFNVDVSYAATSTLPYVATVITDTNMYSLIAVIFQSVFGLAVLVAPTSVILLGTLSYLHIPYGQWLKHIWKLFLQLLALLLVVFIIVLITL